MKLLAWCTALLLLVGVAVRLDEADGDPAARSLGRGGGELELASLTSFDGCGELLDWFQETAATSGVGVGGQRDALEVASEDSSAGASEAATPVAGAMAEADGGQGFSGTNLQEADVDEPDVVKTDGEVIVAVASSGLQVLEPSPGGPVLRSTLALEEGGSEVLLSGDRVLVLTRTWREDAPPAGDQADDGRAMELMLLGRPVTVLTAVDVSDPWAPRVLESRSLDGDYVSARVVGTTARVVLRSSPQVAGVLEDAPLAAWLPTDGEEPLVACDAVSRPAEPAGTGTVTVLTLDVGGSLEPLDAVAVVADAETVYASTDRLYVATTSWAGCCGPAERDRGGDLATSPAGQTTTELHAFDTTGAGTTYVGSGRVAGRLLNSFALSEHEGTLRVATTVEATDGSSTSESAVVTLAEQDGALVERGRIGGLGLTEQIHAVRYQGDVAYVVTFRQTDPLYTLDLADPAAPRLLGELKVPGYSAYLHPIEPGRLLAVGQDATEDGRTQGAQVSTFAVADLTAPGEEDRLSFPDSASPVEWDHRAFLWWPPERLAVVPIETWAAAPEPEPAPGSASTGTGPGVPAPFLGAVALDVGVDGTLAERGRVTHQPKASPDRYPAISRSLVVGDVLYTLSDAGLLATDLTTMAERGWAAF